MPTCAFCPRPTFTSGWVSQELCEPHFELSLIKAHLTRSGRKLTVGTALNEMERKTTLEGYEFSFQRAQVPDLIAEMEVEDFRLAVVLPTD